MLKVETLFFSWIARLLASNLSLSSCRFFSPPRMRCASLPCSEKCHTSRASAEGWHRLARRGTISRALECNGHETIDRGNARARARTLARTHTHSKTQKLCKRHVHTLEAPNIAVCDILSRALSPLFPLPHTELCKFVFLSSCLRSWILAKPIRTRKGHCSESEGCLGGGHRHGVRDGFRGHDAVSGARGLRAHVRAARAHTFRAREQRSCLRQKFAAARTPQRTVASGTL